jgi:hypothetical protein
MAQTKLDLSDNKFEQLSNEILHLSGCTHVFGQFQLESGSTLSILPNHDTGKVLTSNSGGTATWQVIPTIIIPITGATNGLGVTGKKIKLGGALTGNTTIDILTSDLYLCSSTNINRGISLNQTGNELKLSWGDATSACTASISVNDLNVSLSSLYSGGGCAAGLEITHVDNRICFSSTGSNKTYHDNRGFHYVCNYSVGADSRWLPDKGYVDSKVSGNTSASGERITKLICQVSHGFNIKDVIGWSGGTYNKAIADGLYDGEVVGIVSKCYNANCFDLTQAGYITGLTSLSVNTTYFLSDITAGLLTSIEPTGNTHISKSVLIANSSTSGWVLPYAGYVIISGTNAGGTWGTITGILSDQGDLQTCLNGKLASGGTAICATTAGNSLALCGCVPSCFLGATVCAVDSAKLNNKSASFYLNTGSTISCATNASTVGGCTPSCFLGVNATAVCATCAIGAKNLCGCVPASFLLSGGTAVCSTSSIDSKGLCGCVPNCFLGVNACASDSAKLGNHLPSYYLSTGSTAACASDSAKLGGILPAGYLLSGGTAICATCAGNASTVAGCTPSCFLGVNATAVCATCAVGAKNLCGCVPASFLLSGGTAVCSTSSIDSKALCGCVPTCFLGATATATNSLGLCCCTPACFLGVNACAADSNKLNNHLVGYFLNTGSTIALATCSTTAGNALCLNGHPQAYYLLSGGTAVCATCAGNASTIAGCTPSCFLGATACASDSAKLNNKLPAYYLNTGSTITCASDSAKLNNKLPAYYLNTGSTAVCATCAGNASTLVGCTPSCFLGVNATAVCATCAIGAKNLCGCVPASFLLSGGTAVCATCAGNASTLVGCTPSCFLGVTACACDSKCLGTHLPAYYLTSGGTALCATTAGNALCLGGVLPAGYLLSGGTAKNSTCLNGHLEAALSVCNSVCVNGHAEAALSVANSACLNAKLPAYYLNTGSTALCATTAGNALCLGGNLAACYALVANTITGATNGLSVTGKKITLGGTLTGATIINLATNALTFSCGSVISCGTGSGFDSYNNYKLSGTTFLSTPTRIASSGNIAIGYNVLTAICYDSFNAFGVNNVGIGLNVLCKNVCGSRNIGIGLNTLCCNTNGLENIAIGYQALANNSTGIRNFAMGVNTLVANTIGCCNSAIGGGGLIANTCGSFNFAIGETALCSNTTGCYNIAIGLLALACNTTGSTNVAIGICAGYLETGSNKLYIANSATVNPLIYGNFKLKCIKINGNLIVTGCTGIGTIAPAYLLDVAGNIAVCGVGNCLMFDTTGARAANSIYTSNDYWLNLFAGRGDTSKIQLTNSTGILFHTCGTQRMSIGDTGIVTINALASGNLTSASGVITSSSDENLKIADGFIDNALSKVIQLKPRYFYWNEKSELNTKTRQLGFYAQEVNKALGEEVANTPEDGKTWGIYDRGIIAMLTKAIQEQQVQIDELNNRIEELKNK